MVTNGRGRGVISDVPTIPEFSEGTNKNNEEQSICQPWFYQGNFRIRSKNATHYTLTFCINPAFAVMGKLKDGY